MKDAARQLDPEIAELVREAIRGKPGRLFTAPRLEDIPGLSALRDPVPSSAAGLAKAERHLLQVYREQAAWLLRQASMAVSMPRYGARALRCVDLERRVEPRAPAELTERAAAVLENGRAAIEDADCIEALASLGRGASVGPSTMLATLSLRLVPSDEARLCLYGALRADGEEELARGVAEDVVAHLPSALNASIAWSNMASARLPGADWLGARTEYRRAVRQSLNPFATMNWLFTACQVGDEADAAQAAATLDETVPANHPSVEEYMAYREAETFARTPAYAGTVKALLEDVGDTSRKVIA